MGVWHSLLLLAALQARVSGDGLGAIPFGFHMVSSPRPMRSSGNAEGKSCSPGQYADVSKGTWKCTACAAGLYQQRRKMLECDSCPVGYATKGRQGAVKCTECTAGSYADEPASIRCKTCPAGYSTPGGVVQSVGIRKLGNVTTNRTATKCTECPTGLYGELMYATVSSLRTRCAACPAGYYQNALKKSSCAICRSGYTSQPQSSNCASCKAGYAAKWHKRGRKTVRGCAMCAVGTFSAETEYKAERDGTYNEYPSANITWGGSNRSCFQCPAHYYQSRAAQTRCTACPSGYSSFETGEGSCRGTHSLIAFLRTHANVSESGNGTWHAVYGRCAAGYYKPNRTKIGCRVCPAGYYRHRTNQLACRRCVQGTYALTGAAKCKVCHLQKAYYLIGNGTGCIQGNACPAGYFKKAATDGNMKVENKHCAVHWTSYVLIPCASNRATKTRSWRWHGATSALNVQLASFLQSATRTAVSVVLVGIRCRQPAFLAARAQEVMISPKWHRKHALHVNKAL
jgi:hypothetical protein